MTQLLMCRECPPESDIEILKRKTMISGLCDSCRKARGMPEDVFRVERAVLASAKDRARRKGLAFDLELEDIVIPEYCPILGLKLEKCWGKPGAASSSPSLDRIVPRLGYIKGNVAVISHRANTLKNNFTPEEIKKLAAYVEKSTPLREKTTVKLPSEQEPLTEQEIQNPTVANLNREKIERLRKKHRLP